MMGFVIGVGVNLILFRVWQLLLLVLLLLARCLTLITD